MAHNYKPFGSPSSQLHAHQNLNTGTAPTTSGGTVHTVSSKLEEIDHGQLRPVNNSEVFISNRVMYAHYSGCGDNVFFEYSGNCQAPSTCPLGHPSRHDSVDCPPRK
jgi:hypothetical protein